MGDGTRGRIPWPLSCVGRNIVRTDAIGPDELRIPKLRDRIASEHFEVILALNTTIDGQTTAHYIADELGNDVNITTLAKGVPIGGELDYLDDGTISAALRARSILGTQKTRRSGRVHQFIHLAVRRHHHPAD